MGECEVLERVTSDIPCCAGEEEGWHCGELMVGISPYSVFEALSFKYGNEADLSLKFEFKISGGGVFF